MPDPAGSAAASPRRCFPAFYWCFWRFRWPIRRTRRLWSCHVQRV